MRTTFVARCVCFLLPTLASLATAATNPSECRLRGTVTDNFGLPLGSVEIGVEDAVVAVTGPDGTYDVECQPGRIALWLRKAAHAPEARVLDAGSARDAGQRFEMTRLPPGTGVWLAGGGVYVQVPPVVLETHDRIRDDGSVDRQFHLPAGTVLPRVSGHDIRIVDGEPRPLALVEADGDLIGAERHLGSTSEAPKALVLRPIGETGRQVADLSLRRVPVAGDRVACLVGTTCAQGARVFDADDDGVPAWCFAVNGAPAAVPALEDPVASRDTMGALREAARVVEASHATQRFAPTGGWIPLAQLVADTSAPTTDAWGRPLLIEVTDDGRWAIASSGAEGVTPPSVVEGAPAPLTVRSAVERAAARRARPAAVATPAR